MPGGDKEGTEGGEEDVAVCVVSDGLTDDGRFE